MNNEAMEKLLAPPPPPTAQEVIQRMQNSRDRGLGVFFNDCPFDEGYEMLSTFMKTNEFFDHYTHDDIVDLLAVMDILQYNAKAPITKMGEVSSWVGILLKGTVDVYVKGTKVGCIPTGAMIGDTGTIEGGKRSADCEGSEGGGVIALLRFDKMDMLHVKQPALAYQLAMSFGGVVVRKLRQAMGKVFKKDNKARAGENIGKRKLRIEPLTERPDRSVPKDAGATETKDSKDNNNDNNDSNNNDDNNDSTTTTTTLPKPKTKSKWSLVKKSIKSVSLFKAPEKKIGGLTEEEVLYLAREKKIRDPLSEAEEKKMVEALKKMKQERDEALDEVDRVNVALNNFKNHDKALVLEAGIAGAACKRYERFWVNDFYELKHLKREFHALTAVHTEMKNNIDIDVKRHNNIVKDLEDEVEFIRGREVLLGKKCRETDHEMKMVRIRMQAKVLQNDTYVSNNEEEKLNLYASIERLNELVKAKTAETYMTKKKMTALKHQTAKQIKKEQIKRRWHSAVARAVCKRLHAVRQVAKIHAAWFKCTSKETRDKHEKTMNTIEHWSKKVLEADNQVKKMSQQVVHVQDQLKTCNGKCSTLTIGNYLLLYRLLQATGTINQLTQAKATLKKMYLKSEASNVQQHVRTENVFKELQGKDQVNVKRQAEQLRLLQINNALKKEVAMKELQITKLNNAVMNMTTKQNANVKQLQTYLLESDRENVQLSKTR